MPDRARWARSNELFHAAVAKPAAERAAFLSAQCGGDAPLRAEVESLLAAHREGQTDVRPGAVFVGSRLGDYEVTGFIAAGGMGEVYRARDLKLGRDVALKILPSAFVADPDRRARFEREARLLAALNHPHIGAIHGVIHAEGLHGLVLELVEGPTLVDRITRGRIPLDEALPIARQVAEALEAAHAQGIIHRDLKPANIKVRDDGTVKVLDFGLAKALAPDAAHTSGDPTNSPTITSPAMTEVGVILGTAAYMSPEQARGKAADKRSDIWAFGCVLYEILTGQRAVPGGDVADTLAAVLRAEPDFARLPADTPQSIRRLLRRCLEKDPKRRLSDAADARLEVEDALTTTGGEERVVRDAPTPASGRGLPWAGNGRRWLVGPAIIVVAVAAGAYFLGPPAFLSKPRPVVVLMDSTLPERIYDPATRENGGTNSDDISDTLRDLPLELHKETTSSQWHREDQVVQQDPALVMMHLSSFAQSAAPGTGVQRQAEERTRAFLGFVGLANPRTQFIVYTRSFGEDERRAWVSETVERFPALRDRVRLVTIPGAEKATFRDPTTRRLVRQHVESILGYPAR